MTAGKLLFAGMFFLALGGCASQPEQVADARKGVDRNCVRETGTRIKRDEEDARCVNARGKVYTAEDLERTGATTTGEAINRLPR